MSGNIEIITRHEGYKSQIQKLPEGRAQISFNSDGHMVIRLINSKSQDTLIVLDENTSRQLIMFSNKLMRV